MPLHRASRQVDRLVSSSVASCAFAGGLIHLAVVRHHLDSVVVAAAFIAIGSAQLLFSAWMVAGPSARARRTGLLLHLAIVTTWLLSRTVGLVVVPGAEARAAVGVADIVATTLSLAVLASLLTMARFRLERVALPARLSRGLAAAVAIVALAVTVPAVTANHDHGGHGPSAEASGTEHERAPARIHDGHVHVHE